MHSYSHGLGGKHLWPTIQQHIKGYEREMAKTIDERYGHPQPHGAIPITQFK
jgi:hypothetical protein